NVEQEGYAVAPLKNLAQAGLLTALAKILLSFLLLYVGTAFTLLGDQLCWALCAQYFSVKPNNLSFGLGKG
ncbi:hypothetical protein N0Y54_38030, partial [Nostoc punctiforme UO1]|uniref:hypothetical protein n=1 Tax=Nostoc punctiforme TaxID=272131 RepID=UPI0030B6B889